MPGSVTRSLERANGRAVCLVNGPTQVIVFSSQFPDHKPEGLDFQGRLGHIHLEHLEQLGLPACVLPQERDWRQTGLAGPRDPLVVSNEFLADQALQSQPLGCHKHPCQPGRSGPQAALLRC